VKIVGYRSFCWIAQDDKHANIGVVSNESLDAAGQLHVGGCCVEEKLVGRSMSKEPLDVGLGWTVLLYVVPIEQVSFLSISQTDARVGGKGGRKGGGCTLLSSRDDSIDLKCLSCKFHSPILAVCREGLEMFEASGHPMGINYRGRS
jgi:hypothetical protein